MEVKTNTGKQSKKRNKKKKKTSDATNETTTSALINVPPTASNNVPSAAQCQTGDNKDVVQIVPLPKDKNDKTYFNEIEVTLSQPPSVETASKSSKKKKKKNTNKSAAVNNLTNTSDKSKKPNETREDVKLETPLLYFSRDSYSVKPNDDINASNLTSNNVPQFDQGNPKFNKQEVAAPVMNLTKVVLEKLHEINVSVAQPPVVEISAHNPTANEQSYVQQTGSTNTSKKKKKKKKSQSSADKTGKDDSVGDFSAAAVKTEMQDSAAPSSSYVKLPTSDEKCVLIVSGPTLNSSSSSDSRIALAAANNPADTIYNLRNIRNNLEIRPIVSLTDSSTKNVIMTSQAQPSAVPDATPSGKRDKQNTDSKEMSSKPKKTKDVKAKELSESTNVVKASNVDKKAAEKVSASKGKATFTTKFTHLPAFKSVKMLENHLKSNSKIHPAVLAFGIQSAERIIDGSDARCVAFLASLRELIEDYVTPPNKELCRDLETKLEECSNFVSKCRPLSVSMHNAMKFLKYHLTNMPSGTTDIIAKRNLSLQIGKFIEEEIFLAQEAISNNAAAKIVTGDVILTYSFSSVVSKILTKAWNEKKIFKVVVVDSTPQLDGKKLLNFLLELGIDCSYILIGAVSYVMKHITKVFVGAHSLHANGYVMSRIGCSQIALVASWYNVPFLVCCETYKFCERVHTDSLSHNELGNPECFGKAEDLDIVKIAKESGHLQLLNLLYDLTPPHLVSMVITEKGMLPCTSVPVVLRVRHDKTDDHPVMLE